MIKFVAITLAALAELVFIGSIRAQEVNSAPTAHGLELIDALETAVTLGISLSPYDIVGTTFVAREFDDGDDVELSQTIRFRVRFDIDRELLIWAVERRREPSPKRESVRKGGDARPALPGSLSIVATSIHGREVTDCSRNSVSTRIVDSFEKGVIACRIDQLAYWGVLKYPFLGDGRFALRRVASRIVASKSTVSVREVPNGVRYTLREDHEPDRFDVNQWEFELPDHLPVSFKVSRAAAHGRLYLYVDQTLFWEDVRGHRVPVRIASEVGLTRRQNGKFELGVKSVVTEIGWIRVRQADEAEPDSPLILTSAREILKFIDDGRRLANNSTEGRSR